MKKGVLILLCSILLFTLTACNKQTIEQNKDNNGGYNEVMENSKSLVLYFSATGTTEQVAEKIKVATNSDMIEIIPKEEYTPSDLDYNNDNCRANKEQNNPTARPGIKNNINIETYETIYIGYPIWWGTAPKIILTLLDVYDFSNKNIILFCTSGSTGIEQSIQDLKSYNTKLNILGGKRFSSNVAVEEISNWIHTFNIMNQTDKIYLKINDKILSVTLEDNTSSKALLEKLKISDITIEMDDYANFEKVGELGFILPENNQKITTTPGDVILYQGNSITIYYDTNSWNFTKLGHIDDITQEELKQILGTNQVTVTFSIKK